MKSIKINAAANLAIKVLNIVFPLITGPYLARILDKTDYGNFNVANTFVNFFLPFATFGVYNYGVRVISNVKDDPDEVNKIFSRLFYISAFMTVLTTLVYTGYIAFFSDLGDLKPLYYIMSFQILSQILYIEWMNEALENYTFLLYKTLTVRIVMLISIFVLVRKPSDILPYAALMTGINIFNYFLSFIRIKKEVRFVRVRLSDFKPLIKPLFAMLLLVNAGLLYTLTDRMCIASFDRPELVSYYTISSNVIMMLAGVISGAVGVSVPRLGYYLGKDDRESYEYLVNKGAKVFNFLIVPLSFGLTILGPAAILLYAGEKYVAAGLCASVFAVRTIVWAVGTILSTTIVFVNGFERHLTALNLICGFLNVGMNLLLMHFRISEPAAYIFTTMLAEIVLNVMIVILIRRYQMMRLGTIFKNLLEYMIVCIGFIPIAFIVNRVLPVETMVINRRFLINTALIILLCSIYYVVVMAVRKDDVFEEFKKSGLAVARKLHIIK